MNPNYPVYIISKGRWESRLTSNALEIMNVPYHIVIEPQEYDDYAAVINPKKILILPFSNLGQGGIPARNWVWEHSINIGAKSLQQQHPDIVTITRKWGRWQHQVDYSGFKNNRLIKRQGLEVLSGANNYGMKLAEIT